MSLKRYLGCCGAYCKTCKSYIEKTCRGCKIGFDTGERDINKAKCKIKICCFKEKKQDTCADCLEIEKCNLIGDWFSKKGYKYKKYQESIYFIKKQGYSDFFEFTEH